MTVQGANDAPVGVNDTATAVEAGGTAGINPSGNVLANDTDVDIGDTKTVSALTGGTLGTAKAGSYGSLTLNADGSYSYAVDQTNASVQALRTSANTLTDTFTYTVRDAAGATSTATLTVTVQGANDAPTYTTVVANQLANQSVTAGSAMTAYTFGTSTFLDVDSGDTATYSATLADGSALPSWLSFNASTRTFSGTPPANTPAGTITVKVTDTDAGGLSASGNFNIVIQPGNPPTQTLSFTSMTKDTGQMTTITGTPQSPSSNSFVVQDPSVVSTFWNWSGTPSGFGTALGTGTFFDPWAAYNNTTPQVIADDNGSLDYRNLRLDQNDTIAATFDAYKGVTYRLYAGFRKLSGDGLGNTTVKLEVLNPDGTITLVDTDSSSKQGGNGGWDRAGAGGGVQNFTATQSGVHKMLITVTSPAPARVVNPFVQVISAAGEVVTSTVNVVNNSDWITTDSSAGRLLSGTVSASLNTGENIKVYRVVSGVETYLGDATVGVNGTTWTFTDASSYSSNWTYKAVVVNSANLAGSPNTQLVTLNSAGTTTVGGETAAANTITYNSTVSINTLAGNDVINATANTTLAADLASRAVLINGGAGVDTLRLAAGTTLNLLNLTNKQTVTRIQEVEIFQLQGTSTLTMSANNVLSLGQTNLTGSAAGKVQFVVKGTNSDTFVLDGLLSDSNGGNTALTGTWTKQSSSVSYDGLTFDVYDHSTSEAQVLVQTGVTVTLSSSPLVLDLNGDGVQTLAVQAGVAFDLAALGVLQKSAWIDRHDGLLAMDLNHDGQINSGAELLGNNTVLADGSKAADGWAALAALDSNGDGLVDAQDARFADLRVWVDANGDAITDAGELNPLADMGISSLNVSHQASLVKQNGNTLDGVGQFTKADGTTGSMTDAWLQVQQAVSLELSQVTTQTDAHGNQQVLVADGVAQSLTLNLANVMAAPARSDGVHAIKVDGDAVDVITLGQLLADGTQAPGQWVADGLTVVDGHAYNTFHSSSADNLQVLIDSHITQVSLH